MKSYILKNVDDELWKKVRMLAISEDITIRDLIIGLLEKKIKEETKCIN